MTVASSIDADRIEAATRVRDLATEVGPRDRALSQLLLRLAEATEAGRADEARTFAEAIDSKAVAEAITSRSDRGRRLWGVLELVRNAMIFLPIAVTWAGLALASSAYQALLADRPELFDQPFLYLWQRDFFGRGYGLTFSVIATADAVLIALIIGLSGAIHYRIDINDPDRLALTVLKASEVRSTLGRAAHAIGDESLADEDADFLLRRIAEEKRTLERIVAREQSLFDLREVVTELRLGSEQLATFGDRTASSQERTNALLERLVIELDRLAKRDGQLTLSIEGLGARIGDAAAGTGAINGVAAGAVTALESQQRAITAEASQLLRLLEALGTSQQAAGSALATQATSLLAAVAGLDQTVERLGKVTNLLATIGPQLPAIAQQLSQSFGDFQAVQQQGAVVIASNLQAFRDALSSLGAAADRVQVASEAISRVNETLPASADRLASVVQNLSLVQDRATTTFEEQAKTARVSEGLWPTRQPSTASATPAAVSLPDPGPSRPSLSASAPLTTTRPAGPIQSWWEHPEARSAESVVPTAAQPPTQSSAPTLQQRSKGFIGRLFGR